MPTFSEQVIQRIPDLAVQEETRRSIEARGLAGHYLAGAYRVIGRPAAQWSIIQKARLLNFLWGMDEVSNYLETLPQRYMNAVMREFGASIADNAIFLEGLRLATVHGIGLSGLRIGYKAFSGRRLIIDLSHEVSFGDFCTLGNNTQYISHTDFASSPLKAEISPMKNGPVRIGRGAFIGSNTMIAHSTTIGECAIIGANSFVDKHVPPYTFAAGVPAKVIAHINRDKIAPFDPALAIIVPEGSTASDFDYDNPRSLKIPANCGIIGADE
jgi:acetyltransferase-like isoleucine patch superfamily enzyme